MINICIILNINFTVQAQNEESKETKVPSEYLLMDHSSIIMAYRLIHSNLNRSHRKKHGKSKEQQVSKDGDSYE